MNLRQRLFGSRPIIKLGKAISPLGLPLRDNVDDVTVLGDGVRRMHELGTARAVICPNHPSEADGDVIFTFSRIVEQDFHFLAARELFATWRELFGILLTLGGCYSINRGSSEAAPLKAIRDDLVRGENKIVIFPEGEISHRFNSLLPLESGAARLCFWALQELQSAKKDEPVLIIPVGISYVFREDARKVFDNKLSRLEQHLGISRDRHISIVRRLYAILDRVVASIEAAYGCETKDYSLEDRLTELRKMIVHRVAYSLGIDELDDNEVSNVHKLQDILYRAESAEHQRTPYLERLCKQRRSLAAVLNRDLKRVMNLRLCLQCFTGPYQHQEISEALYMLEAEILGHPSAIPRRRAVIDVGEPIDVREWFSKYVENHHLAVEQLTAEIEHRLRALQEQLLREVQSYVAASLYDFNANQAA
jgi:hypothetical protein